MNRLTPVSTFLLIAMIAGYALQTLAGDSWIAALALWPLDTAVSVRSSQGSIEIGFAPWQMVSYAFLHGGLLHLFVTSFALWMFGPPIERLLGRGAFATYWFSCVIGAAAAQLLTLRWSLHAGEIVPTIGASGGVFGLLLAFGMFFPRERILLLFPPISLWLVAYVG